MKISNSLIATSLFSKCILSNGGNRKRGIFIIFEIFAQNFQFLFFFKCRNRRRGIFLRSIDRNFQFLDRDKSFFQIHFSEWKKSEEENIFSIDRWKFLIPRSRQVSFRNIEIREEEYFSDRWKFPIPRSRQVFSRNAGIEKEEDIFEYLRNF